MTIEIRRLLPEDDRSRFRSGDIELDRFFQRFAGQNQFRYHIGTTYVAVEDAFLHGFVTVAAAEIQIDGLPEKMRRGLPSYPLPALRSARLAVHGTSQGRGIGRELLKAAFVLAREPAEKVGCAGVVIEVIQGELRDRPQPSAMFLPLASIPRP